MSFGVIVTANLVRFPRGKSLYEAANTIFEAQGRHLA